MTLAGDRPDRYQARPWGERLREWREEVKHWSRSEFREQIEAASYKMKELRGHRLDTRLIGRWETGEVYQPQAVYRRILAHLGAPLPSSIAPADPTCTEDDEDMNRRRFLRHAGTAVAAAVAAQATFYGDRQVPGRIDLAHIRGLRSSVNSLYRRDQILGGAGLAEAARRQYYDARHMLDEADYQETVGRELMIIAGELAVCVGWLSYDGGDQRQARELYSEAFLLADQAGDTGTGLAIQSMEKMALQSVHIADKGRHRGAAREAVRLSCRVADLARRESSPRLHALLAGRQAIAHAVVGDDRAFRGSITRAWREIDRAGPIDGEETWLKFATRSEIMVHEAKGCRYLGRPGEAARLHRASLEDPELSARNRANYQAQLASSLAALGDGVGAVAEGMGVLSLLEDSVASPRTLAELQSVRHIAHSQRHVEFCERYDRVIAGVLTI